ncbi:MAG: phage integrase SAM-like domain-containing protein [Cyclobacteriaceae bacterium]
MSSNYIVKVGDCYRYRRRVPAEVANFDPRKEVKVSLKTRDFKTAQIRAGIYNDQIESFWKSLIHANNGTGFNQKYLAAVQLAKAYGFAYKTPEQIAASTLTEIVQRLSQTNVASFGEPEQARTEALLGGVDSKNISISDCWTLFEGLVHDRLVEKSDDQIRKWKNVRRSAINNFVKVSEIKYLHEVTRTEILKFWDWLNLRIQNGYKANTANKQLSNLKDVLKTVSTKNQIDLNVAALFVETSFKETSNSRPPFEAKYVQDILLPAVMDLNARDHYAFWAIADTGMRQSELFGLTPDDIFIEEEIPYVWIRPRKGYSLKTPDSERKIPLVGAALMAFKKFPKGFMHTGNAECFSASVNNFLTVKGLRPTPEHSAYSLRHTFKDRLRDYGEMGAPEEIIDELMGHKKPGVHYGRGHKLETKHKILYMVAYKV